MPYRLFFSTVVGHHLAAGGCPCVEFWGKILSFFPIFWVFWQRFEFFPLCSLNKSCPNFEFWAKNGLEFFQIGQKLSFFRRWVFAKMLKKKPGLLLQLHRTQVVSGFCLLIINWERLVSRMGYLMSGPRGGTGPWGQYKIPNMGGSIRGRARSALYSRV